MNDQYKNMYIVDYFEDRGNSCPECDYVAENFGPTTSDVWLNCNIGIYQWQAYMFAITDGLIEADTDAMQLIINDLVELHACVDESERGRLCPVFDDSPQTSSVAWVFDWISHINNKHGGPYSDVSGQIADLIRLHIGVNPYQ